MRLIILLLISLCLYASDFPLIFSSAGDEVYKGMQRYEKIKGLEIYKERPELLEAYCMDANATMQKGFLLDKMKDDPELEFDKALLKEYAQELRSLSKQNEVIISQLDADVGRLYEEGDFESLKKINEAGFILSTKMMVGIKTYEDKKAFDQKVAILNKQATKQTSTPATAPVSAEVSPKAVPQTSVEVQTSAEPEIVPEKSRQDRRTHTMHKSKELLAYENSLAALKAELYTLRESEDQEKMACLNDITAINYWMIKVLENRQDACQRAAATRQMKSYDKAASRSCGRSSMRYIEWHGRLKPYVGKKLFEAEAGCTQ